MRVFAFVLLALLVAPLASSAQDKIWAGLVLATNEMPAQPVPRKLRDFAPTLRRVFGYNSFYLLGEKSQVLMARQEHWLIPSRRIFMKVAMLEMRKTAYRLGLELYDGPKQLVTTEALLARDAPLYIRGPAWGRGQLVVLLEVR